MPNVIPAEIIENRIFMIRKRKVMLDSHLAELYGVTTSALNQAVKRNRDRFPTDFTFQLTENEAKAIWSQNAATPMETALLESHAVVSSGKAPNLKSQFVISSYGGRRTLPRAFTEQGVAMLSSVLKSRHAVQVNIMIMRTFVKLREIMATHIELARKIETVEMKYAKHDDHIQMIFKLIKKLLEPPVEPIEPEKPPIGFHVD